jgi:hypothetical protein
MLYVYFSKSLNIDEEYCIRECKENLNFFLEEQLYSPYLLNKIACDGKYVAFEKIKGDIFNNCRIEDNNKIMIFVQILIGYEILNRYNFDVEKCKIYLIERKHVKIGVII